MEPLRQRSPQDRETDYGKVTSMGRSGEMERRYLQSVESRHELGRDAWTASPQCAYSEWFRGKVRDKNTGAAVPTLGCG